MVDLVRLAGRYVRSHIISSDYEGCVTLWDVDTQTAVNEYEAHDKRIWSVDYCTADPLLFVSGSDDGFIKVRPSAPLMSRRSDSRDQCCEHVIPARSKSPCVVVPRVVVPPACMASKAAVSRAEMFVRCCAFLWGYLLANTTSPPD